MHVLQLGPYPPPEGGINRNLMAIRDELLKNGHRCSVIAISKSSAIVPADDVYHPTSPFHIIKLLLTMPYDVLHLHVGGVISTRLLGLILICGILGHGRNILSFHSGGYTETPAGKRARKFSVRGFIFRRFSHIIAVNSRLAEVFERYGIARDKISVIYPFVHRLPDKSVELPVPICDFAARSKPFLLTVGLLEDEYDLFMQIDAMEKVLDSLPDAGLMIVGSGSLKARLAAVIADRSYSDRIFLAGDVEHRVTLNLIDHCDILLRTTLYDGDAISVREALFLGTPVIATDNGMRPDGVRLIRVGDKRSLIEEIGQVALSGSEDKPTPVEDTANILAITNLYGQVRK